MGSRTPKSGQATFTNKELEALTVTDDKTVLRETGGLAGEVRASRTGSVAVYWTWRFRFAGKVKEIRLGSWPKVAMREIRHARDEAALFLRDGKDPAAERLAEKLKTEADQVEAIEREKSRIAEINTLASRMTVADLFQRWKEHGLSKRKDKGKEIERTFAKDVLPNIGGMYANEVSRKQIATLLDNVAARGARIIARNMLGDLRQMFGFAIRRGLLENDPTSHMKRDDYGKKVERDRIFSEKEIRALPSLIAGAGMVFTSVHSIWIMLATCCRVGELSKAKWADVDLECRQWRIPPDNAKNGKEHIIDLSNFAIRHFEAIKMLNGTSQWVLPAKHNVSAVCAKSLAKQIGDRQRDGDPMKNRSPLVGSLKLPGGKWTPHDLRRTGATLMGALGVLPEVVERCLNHTEQNSLKRIYQRHDYRTEMHDAWRLLGDRLELLTREDADNVLTLQRAA